jgi:hypothetical protein
MNDASKLLMETDQLNHAPRWTYPQRNIIGYMKTDWDFQTLML